MRRSGKTSVLQAVERAAKLINTVCVFLTVKIRIIFAGTTPSEIEQISIAGHDNPLYNQFKADNYCRFIMGGLIDYYPVKYKFLEQLALGNINDFRCKRHT